MLPDVDDPKKLVEWFTDGDTETNSTGTMEWAEEFDVASLVGLVVSMENV